MAGNYVVRVAIVTWSNTEKREIRNFAYLSVFELAGRQRLTVKRGIRNIGQLRPAVKGIRNVGQFLAAEVTNPGQNESQQMFALCDWVKEIVVQTNRLTEKRC